MSYDTNRTTPGFRPSPELRFHPGGVRTLSVPFAKQFRGERTADRPFLAQRLAIERRDRRTGRRERALDAGREVSNEALVDADLAVGELLDEDGAQKGVVRRRERHRRHRPQPRGEVAQAHGPAAGRAPGGDQDKGPLLARKVEEVEKRAL